MNGLLTPFGRYFIVAVLMICIAGCTARVHDTVTPHIFSSNSFTPQPQMLPQAALRSNGGTMQTFADAMNVPLSSDDDYGRFVDPQVVGRDRILAIRLLKLMPPSSRGDFTYVDGSHVLSNRLSLKNGIRFARPTDPQAQLVRTITGSGRTTSSYPPTGGSGGPFIRNYSAQGVNAGLGYATVPCDSAMSGGDNGFMYFNAYTANSSGSIVDAGLSIDTAINAHPFINSQGNYIYSGWTDENYT
jgi:hypothetical protein